MVAVNPDICYRGGQQTETWQAKVLKITYLKRAPVITYLKRAPILGYYNGGNT